MRPEKLIFSKDGEEEDNPQTLNEADEESSGEESDSDSGSEEEEGTAAVPPKKPKLNPTREEEGPVVGEEGSECSSPSASGFIIMPTAKPSEKQTPFSKKFSEEDEIALLKGLAVFWANGRNNKWAEFYLFIQDKLSNQFTKIQVSEKIRRLKTKFENNYKRARANGGWLEFSDSHESILFELSKTLWGEDKSFALETEKMAGNKHAEEKKTPIAGKTRKRAGKEHDEEKQTSKKQKEVMEIGKEEFAAAYPLLSSSFDVLGYSKMIKEEFLFIGREKAQELEEKWRELKDAELRLELKRIELIRRDLHNYFSSK